MPRISGGWLRTPAGAFKGLFCRSASSQQGRAPQTRDLITGAALEKVAVFDASHVRDFIQMTGDSNPIHTSSAAAEAQGFQACIVPGLLCASLFPAIIGSAFPGALYMTQDLKFRHPALVGEPLLARVTLTAKSGTRWRFRTECFGRKEDIIIDGTAIAIIKEKSREH